MFREKTQSIDMWKITYLKKDKTFNIACMLKLLPKNISAYKLNV